VVILADDLGWGDVGYHGSQIKTPNIDSLAATGARLEQFYVQPVCTPTRAAFLTGRYPLRYGLQVDVVRPHSQHGLALTERTLPQALKEAGYATAIVGKWHLGHARPEYLPMQRGFDHQYGHYTGGIDYFKHRRSGGHDWRRDQQELHEQGYSTELMGRECARLISEHDLARPLFLYVPFNAVHAPVQATAESMAPYRDLPEQRRTYAGALAAMDEAIGVILQSLEARGMTKDTLVIFASDNGGANPGKLSSNGPLRAGKETLYEGGTRVAASATWPGQIPAGVVVDHPIHIVDLYPTLVTLAGGATAQPLPLDGVDLWDTLSLGRASTRTEILLNATPVSGAIRAGRWKLVWNGESGAAIPDSTMEELVERGLYRCVPMGDAVELFDLHMDPHETTDVAELHPERVRELRARFAALIADSVPPLAAPAPANFEIPAVWGEPSDAPDPDRR